MFVFVSLDSQEADVKMEQQQLEQLKRKVRNMLMEDDKPSQKLNLIDAIQRLGVAYHFETEIEAELQHMYETYQQHDHKFADHDDLYTMALSFRLLRQEGYPISCGKSFSHPQFVICCPNINGKKMKLNSVTRQEVSSG